MEEWLLVSGAPASNVGADEDSRGISRVESPLAEGSTNTHVTEHSGHSFKINII